MCIQIILVTLLFGDTLYGKASELISRQALHSIRTIFIHPITKQKVEYMADLPEDFKVILKNPN